MQRLLVIAMKFGGAIQSLRGMRWLIDNYRNVFEKLNQWSRNPTIKKVAIGVIVAWLLLSLLGCKKLVTKPEVIKLTPPTQLMMATPEPKLNGNKNRDLALWALRLLEALRQSNADKSAIREWFNGTP